MAKAPLPGKVKTRLVPHLSLVEAAEFADCLLKDRLAEMEKLDSCDRALAYSPADARPLFETRCCGPFLLFPQTDGDLGQRIRSIFHQKFAEGYGAIVIIGTDIPDLTKAVVLEGFSQLESKDTDLILGPAEDGGYYLIGMKRLHHELFENIPWSTDSVLRMTTDIARKKGLQLSLLDTLQDIDTIQDIRSYYRWHDRRDDGKTPPDSLTLAYLTRMSDWKISP